MCSVCEAEVDDDGREVCWKCSASRQLPKAEVEQLRDAMGASVKCLRCEQPMEYGGKKKFHEGSRVGVFGDLGELFVRREVYDVYFCGRCGKVEFFIDGIGDASRGEPNHP